MPAFLLSPLARWGLLAALFGAALLWGWTERAGRQMAVLEAREAIARADAAEARVKNMEARNAVEDRVRREPDPVGRLRDGWTRPE